MLDIGLEHLKEFLEYDPFTGEFTWLPLSEECLSCTGINRRNANKREGTVVHSKDGSGYIKIRLGSKQYHAHRLAWLYVYGVFPNGDIDHINHNREDNRLANLRVVSKKENQKNQSKFKNNISGFTGVCRIKSNSKWRATLYSGGKTILLGYYNTKEEAILARKIGNVVYGFHENHGL